MPVFLLPYNCLQLTFNHTLAGNPPVNLYEKLSNLVIHQIKIFQNKRLCWKSVARKFRFDFIYVSTHHV